MRRPGAIVVLICSALLTTTTQADYQAGLDAYKSGDYDRAFREWIAVADSAPNDVHPDVRAETYYALGMLYWVGQGVPQDTERSAHWLKQAAELNHAGAQTKLGYLYSTGQGVPQSNYEAFKWLQMAASQGDADAQYNLGVFYREGLGVEANGTEALKWFRMAAANGDAESAAIVAQYEAGLPVTGISDTAGSVHTSQAAVVEAAVAKAPVPDSGNLPKDETWISMQEPEHYTIQVVALRDRDKLLRFIDLHPEWSPWAIYQQTLKDRPLWVLVQGDYSDVEQARKARQQFPAKIQKRDKLWIRQFKMVQALLQ